MESNGRVLKANLSWT